MSGACDLVVSVESESGEKTELMLRGMRFVVGRLNTADIVLDHPAVSRQHAEVYRDPFGRWWIRDLGSRHGVRVNERVVDEEVLTEHDQLHIGRFTLRLSVPGRRPAPTDDADFPTVPLSDGGLNEDVAAIDARASSEVIGERLRALITLSTEMGGARNSDDRRRLLCRCLSGQIPAQTAALVLRVHADDPDRPPLELRRDDNPNHARMEDVHISRTLLRHVCRERQPAVASNAGNAVVDTRLSVSPSQRLLTALACPLDDRGDQLDLLYVMTGPQYATEEWLAIVTMASTIYEQAEMTRRLQEQLQAHEAIERDLRRARQIQSRLLPRDISCEGVDVAIGFEPCRWVGGDYVDVIPCGERKHLLVVADVCGKGLPAALITGNLHALVHAHAARDVPLVEMYTNMNEYLEQTLPDESFVTMLAVRLDAGSGEYECIAAGHPKPLRFEASAVVEAAPLHVYPPLGICDQSFEAYHGRLSGGEWWMCFTDGATDICNEQGVRLEDDGLLRIFTRTLMSRSEAPAAEVMKALDREFDAYQGRSLPVDDRTFLVVHRLPNARA